jgi:hypothetical protein
MNQILQADIFTLPYVSFIGGLLFCFFGRKLLGFIVIFFAFLIGFTWGAPFLADLIGGSLLSSPWIKWAAGICGAVIGLVAWKVSLFFVGTVIGLFIARGFLPMAPGLAHAGIAVISGILAQLYRDPIISLLTAIAGAYIAAGSALILLQMVGFMSAIGGYTSSINSGSIILMVLTLIFALVGYKFQTRGIKT